MAVTTIEKLVVALGFDFDPKGLTQFQQGVENVESVVKGLTKTLVGATAAIFGLTAATTDAVDEQGKMAAQIGVSVEDLDAYETAAALAGDAVGGMSSSLQQLSIRASEATRGMGSGIEAFGILGVSATDTNGNLKDTVQLMLEVSGAIQGLDNAKQIELSEKLGLSSSIRLLQQGPTAIKELVTGVKELGVTTAEDAAIAAEFQDSLVNIWKVIKQVSKLITRTFAPIMSDLSDNFLEWWKVNQDIIKQRLPEWIEKTERAMKLLALAAAIFAGAQLVTIISTLIKSFKGFSALLTLINQKLLLVPSLIAVAIAAVLLLAQDAATFFEGGDSFFGDWIKKFPAFENGLLVIASAFAAIWDIIQLIGSGWGMIWDAIVGVNFDWLKETLGLIPGWFGSVISYMSAMFDDFILYLMNKFPALSDVILNVGSGLKATLSAVGVIIKTIGEGIGALIFALSNFSLDGMKQVLLDIIPFMKYIASKIITTLTDGFKNVASNILEDFKTVFSNIGTLITEALKDVGKGVVGKIAGGVKRLFGGEEEKQNQVGDFLADGVPLVPSFDQGGSTTENNSTTSTQTTTIGSIQITIDGAQEPAAIAEELQRQLTQASQDVNSGVFQ